MYVGEVQKISGFSSVKPEGAVLFINGPFNYYEFPKDSISYDITTKRWSLQYTPTEKDFDDQVNPVFLIAMYVPWIVSEQNSVSILRKQKSTGGCQFNLFG
jgi:hypothetical protein